MDYVRVVVKCASQPQIVWIPRIHGIMVYFSGVEVSDRAIPQLDYVDSTEKTSGKYGWLMFFLRSTYFFKSLFSQEKNISNVNQ